MEVHVASSTPWCCTKLDYDQRCCSEQGHMRTFGLMMYQGALLGNTSGLVLVSASIRRFSFTAFLGASMG